MFEPVVKIPLTKPLHLLIFWFTVSTWALGNRPSLNPHAVTPLYLAVWEYEPCVYARNDFTLHDDKTCWLLHGKESRKLTRKSRIDVPRKNLCKFWAKFLRPKNVKLAFSKQKSGFEVTNFLHEFPVNLHIEITQEAQNSGNGAVPRNQGLWRSAACCIRDFGSRPRSTAHHECLTSFSEVVRSSANHYSRRANHSWRILNGGTSEPWGKEHALCIDCLMSGHLELVVNEKTRRLIRGHAVV